MTDLEVLLCRLGGVVGGAAVTVAVFLIHHVYRTGSLAPNKAVRMCDVPKCDDPERARGLCAQHLQDFVVSPEYAALESDEAGLHRNPTAVDKACEAWLARVRADRGGA